MTNAYNYDNFQNLNDILAVLKSELENFDSQDACYNRCKLRKTINKLIDNLQLNIHSPYVRKIYGNWKVLNESRCTKQDLAFIIEALTIIKRDLFSQYYDKIFISHSEKDKEVVDSFISLLHNIGIPKSTSESAGKIFCSSYNGYVIPLRENNIEYIKAQLNSTDNILAIIMYSQNYVSSPACLNEAGAIWVKDIPFQPIILPGFSFAEVKGFLNPSITGFEICNNLRLNEFQEQLLQSFNLPAINYSLWEQDRNKFIKEVQEYSKIVE